MEGPPEFERATTEVSAAFASAVTMRLSIRVVNACVRADHRLVDDSRGVRVTPTPGRGSTARELDAPRRHDPGPPMTTLPPTARKSPLAFAVAGAIEDLAPGPAGRGRRVIRGASLSVRSAGIIVDDASQPG